MLKRMSACFLALIFVVSTQFIPSSFAYFEKSAWAKRESYNDKMTGKIAFGLANLTVGQFELFEEPYTALQTDRMFWGGVARGIVNGILDPIEGALHLATFFIPVDIPLPEGGTNMARIE